MNLCDKDNDIPVLSGFPPFLQVLEAVPYQA